MSTKSSNKKQAAPNVETKPHDDGTIVTGITPLPEGSPTAQAQPADDQSGPAEGQTEDGQGGGEPAGGAEGGAGEGQTKGGKKASKAVAGTGSVRYISREKEVTTYEIRVRNVKLRPSWDGAQERLVFDVPADLAEAFELHTHFVSGRVVRADK